MATEVEAAHSQSQVKTKSHLPVLLHLLHIKFDSAPTITTTCPADIRIIISILEIAFNSWKSAQLEAQFLTKSKVRKLKNRYVAKSRGK